MFEISLKNHYLKDNYIGSDYKEAVIETEDFTAGYIQEMAYVMNLELNFVENPDFRLGNYKMALKGFENVIKVRSDHAIAFYYAAQCYKKIGELNRARQYMDIARAKAQNPFWLKYIEMFHISI